MPLLLLLLASVVPGQDEASVRRLLSSGKKIVRLPAGQIQIASELQVPAGTQVLGNAKGTILKASDRFHGRALLICESGVTISDLTIDGNRRILMRPARLAPPDETFASFYEQNGILAEKVRNVRIHRVIFRNITNFAVLISGSSGVIIDYISVSDSGSLNKDGRNNTTGGVLLEEGTANFTVRNSTFRRIRGNGVWTHSLYTSPRNGPGRIVYNRFEVIGRDAIQAGHATKLLVQENDGHSIGYPVSEVDMAGGGMPVAIDTAGDVDHSSYSGNRFRRINGKCIDLDGFHDGDVMHNICVNEGPLADRPFGHYGIVFNNTNPDMESRNIRVMGNIIDGTTYGGIFVIGRGHTVARNRLTRLNLARCDDPKNLVCQYDGAQPDLLRAGIYLGSKAERPDIATGNIITDNVISGNGMKRYCIVAAPGVALEKQTIKGNTCMPLQPAHPERPLRSR